LDKSKNLTTNFVSQRAFTTNFILDIMFSFKAPFAAKLICHLSTMNKLSDYFRQGHLKKRCANLTIENLSCQPVKHVTVQKQEIL